jgi:hypothetical protein
MEVAANLLYQHFEEADFFKLRTMVVWQHHPVSFLLCIGLFIYLLLNPFFKRYKMLIKHPDMVDIALENQYKSIIDRHYDQFIAALKKSELVRIIQDQINDATLDEKKHQSLQQMLDCLLNTSAHYDDPPYKVKPASDNRKFLQKGSLAKYLNQL